MGMIAVEVVYALPEQQVWIALHVPPQTTVIQAVHASGLLQQQPELAAQPLVLGIYGKVVAPDTLVKADDRIEIYRPLQINPKQARRQRAAHSARKTQQTSAAKNGKPSA